MFMKRYNENTYMNNKKKKEKNKRIKKINLIVYSCNVI